MMSPRLLKPANQMSICKWVETITRERCSIVPTPLAKDYKKPLCIRCFSNSGILRLQPPERVSTGTMGDSCCLGNATAIPAVPTTSICSSGSSFMVSVCLVPVGAEHGNWLHAKKTVSHVAVPQVAVNLLLANQPAFQQLLVWVLYANPFAPTRPAVKLAPVSLLVQLAHASPPVWNLPAVQQSAVNSGPRQQSLPGMCLHI